MIIFYDEHEERIWLKRPYETPSGNRLEMFDTVEVPVDRLWLERTGLADAIRSDGGSVTGTRARILFRWSNASGVLNSGCDVLDAIIEQRPGAIATASFNGLDESRLDVELRAYRAGAAQVVSAYSMFLQQFTPLAFSLHVG